jgi:hypothetical protein
MVLNIALFQNITVLTVTPPQNFPSGNTCSRDPHELSPRVGNMRIIILDSGGAASHSATSAVSFALLSGCVQVASTYPGSVHHCNEMSSKAIRCH